MITIGGIAMPLEAGFGINQSLYEIMAKTLQRNRGGSGIAKSRWRKLGTRIDGSGWIPDGLDGLNLSVPQVIQCGVSVSITGPGPTLTIPRAFRTDTPYEPKALARIGWNIVTTGLSLAGSVATPVPVTGANDYRIVYFPVLLCDINAVERTLNDQTVEWSWSLSAEEI